MTGGVYGLIRVAMVGVALALTACQTTAPQKIPKYTGWRPMIEEQSEVRFIGEHKPRISSMRTRWYKGQVRQEEVYFKTDSTASSSRLRAAFASMYFNDPTSAKYHDPQKIRIAAVDNCSGAEIGPAVEAINDNGSYLYAICRFMNNDLCV